MGKVWKWGKGEQHDQQGTSCPSLGKIWWWFRWEMKQCAREKWVVSTGLAAASVCVRRDKVGVKIRAKEMSKITLV